MSISVDIKYVGINDHHIDLFEGQYPVPNGMAYNSYAILDEKIAIMDTVDIKFGEEWLNGVREALAGRKPDYLVVHHMEPDHSANIMRFANEFPQAVIVGSAKAFTMMKSFFNEDFGGRCMAVKDGDTLQLGRHCLTFYTAPMVHWPEVIVSYDSCDKLLFSADAFGKFGALDVSEEWVDEARRYYIGIVSKYGVQVQALLKKAAKLDIAAICPLHGPVISENIGQYIGLYEKWSRYEAEEQGVVIAYTSIYGNTKRAVDMLAQSIRDKGGKATVFDLARCDMFEAVAEAFRYDKLVLASTTYNGEVFPFMREYIHHLVERNFQSRTVAFVENGSWAPMAAKVMKGMLEKSSNLTYTEGGVRIISAVNQENTAQIRSLAEELCRA